MPQFNEHDAAIAPYAQNPINRLAKFADLGRFITSRARHCGPFHGCSGCPSPAWLSESTTIRCPRSSARGSRGRWITCCVGPSRFALIIWSLLPAGRRYVIVTADDGWISFVENALPELRSRNIPVTIFVIADRTGDSMGEAADHIVSEAELRGLVA